MGNGLNTRELSGMTSLLRAAALAVMVLALAPTVGQAAEVGDAATGHALAQKWCAGCHIIDRAQGGSIADGIPPFASVAAMSSTTSLSLHAFLTTPHSPMPDIQLSRRQIDDLVAYILSLKP